MSINSTSTTRIPTSILAPQVFPTLPHGEMEIIFATIVYVLLALFVTLGNILVITAFRFNSRLRTINNTFLLGLAVSDLLVGLISIPLWIYFSYCQQYLTCVDSKELLTFYSTVDIFTGCALRFAAHSHQYRAVFGDNSPDKPSIVFHVDLLRYDRCGMVFSFHHGRALPLAAAQVAETLQRYSLHHVFCSPSPRHTDYLCDHFSDGKGYLASEGPACGNANEPHAKRNQDRCHHRGYYRPVCDCVATVFRRQYDRRVLLSLSTPLPWHFEAGSFYKVDALFQQHDESAGICLPQCWDEEDFQAASVILLLWPSKRT